ncbi:ATP-binding protein [Vampirovibrio sp.]|uniref:PAS domain-containing sensor histidine kinase n=1 Tax=Vampirovibrio sp. TaxID=2717857 RepID=UPI003592F2FC
MSIATPLVQESLKTPLLEPRSLSSGFANSVLNALLAQASDCIAVKDLSGRYLTINAAGTAFLGREISEVVGKTDFELFTQETAGFIAESDQRVIDSGQTQIFEDFLRPLNGEERYFQAMKCAYVSEMGETLGIINVVRDITATKLAEQALKRSNQDLEQFTSVVSHDLQAPLRKIIFFANELDRESPSLTPEAQDYLLRIQKTSKKMSALITDLLSLSRVTQTRPQYRMVHLKHLIEEAIQEVSPGPKSLIEHFELLGVEQELMADSFQLRQLLINLFSNALKFQATDNVPKVQVTAVITAFQQCLITVTDNGIGFDEKYLPHLFKPFERLQSSQAYAGTGIGLALCERIVQRHHGRITAKSSPGQGATFYVELPLIQN